MVDNIDWKLSHCQATKNTFEHSLMMSQMAAPQSNAKRYWGDERNIDSIYAIYIKKICYTHSNDNSVYTSTNGDDLSLSSASQSRRNSQEEKNRRIPSLTDANHSTSSNDVTRLANLDQQVCQKKDETTRSRRNFFQKYRRRSCSVDKYSFEKQHKTGEATMTVTTPKHRAKSRYGGLTSSLTKKKPSNQFATFGEQAEDIVDGQVIASVGNDSNVGPTKTSKNLIDRGDSGSSKTSSRLNVFSFKSMNDISLQAQAQSLIWETRQIKVLQAATLDHVLKFILLINSGRHRNHNSVTGDAISNRNSPGLEANEANSNVSSLGDDTALEEDRNNVAHIIHVFFCTYRIYTNPYELMLKLMLYSDICRIEQYRFVMLYWMDNYPEDFDYPIESSNENNVSKSGKLKDSNTLNDSFGANSVNNSSMTSFNNSVTSYDSSMTGKTNAASVATDSENRSANIDSNQIAASSFTDTTSSLAHATDGYQNLTLDDSSQNHISRRLSNVSLGTARSFNATTEKGNHLEDGASTLLSELLQLSQDDHIRKKALKLRDYRRGPLSTSGSIDSTGSETVSRHRSSSSRHYYNQSSKNSAVLDLDSRYVAQQLTAIDLDNFLNLRPYAMLDGTKSDRRIQSMIKNFNLLSRHVVVTILRSHNPNIVAAHWIAIALNLRRIKNFNSLKAIIAGLTNESIYRLKQSIWKQIDRVTIANFEQLAKIVDDVNNQTVLRQTQLVAEGTAKMSIEDDSFGTIPYLGTFLTDLNMIDARYQNYVPSPKDETSKLKLINLEKCAKQFEILTQVQLLQKNVLASLNAIQRRNNFDEQTTLSRLRVDKFNHSQQMLSAKPVIPKVSRLFENWFFDDNVSAMTDKQCYEISMALEQNVIQR